MFSLQKMLGQNDHFFDLLESSAKEAHLCSQILNKLLKNPTQSATLHELREARQRNKQITEKIDTLVVKTFVTALEREDIESLAHVLYKIPKPLEKFAERFLISSSTISEVDFLKQAQMLENASMTVLEMVRALRSVTNFEQIKKLNTKLQQAEAEADTLELELLRDLYRSSQVPLKIFIVKDLYELLEKVMDRCRDAGTVITHIMLKNA